MSSAQRGVLTHPCARGFGGRARAPPVCSPYVGCNTRERWVTASCHPRSWTPAHVWFCRCLRDNKSTSVHFWEGSEAGMKLPEEMGTDV